MSKRFCLIFFFSWLLFMPGSRLAMAEGPTYALVDGRRSGDLSQVKATLQVVGKLHSPSETLHEVPLAASCQVSFQDLFGAKAGQLSGASARQYDTAVAELRVGNHEESTQLPANLSTIVAAQREAAIEFVSPHGPLSRKELDTITLPGDALAVYRLLPGHPVAEGQQWKSDPEDLAMLLNLEHVGVNETKSELVKVENGLAQMRITGLVKGRASGVATELRITGDYRYDLKWQHINWLQLRINEQRDESRVAPGFAVDAELRMLIKPMRPRDVAPSLQNVGEISARDRLLRYESASAGYRILHPRRWHLVDERPRHASWRIVEGDDIIAQCNAIRLKDMPAGKQLALEEFQSDIQKALGDQFGQFEAADQKQRDDGNQILRVAVRGVASEVPVCWVYYHIANQQGQCANLVFVMDVEEIKKLGKDDMVAATTVAITASANTLPEIPQSQSSEEVANETASLSRGQAR